MGVNDPAPASRVERGRLISPIRVTTYPKINQTGEYLPGYAAWEIHPVMKMEVQ